MMRRMVCIFTVALLMLLPLTTVSARTFTAGTRYSSTDTLSTCEHSNLYYITAHNLQLLLYSVEIVGNGSFYFYLSYGLIIFLLAEKPLFRQVFIIPG